MPKIKCKCDNFISYSEIPNPNEYLVISDVAFDKYDEQIEREKLYTEMKSILCCDSCGRLWIFWDGFENEPTPYFPEK